MIFSCSRGLSPSYPSHCFIHIPTICVIITILSEWHCMDLPTIEYSRTVGRTKAVLEWVFILWQLWSRLHSVQCSVHGLMLHLLKDNKQLPWYYHCSGNTMVVVILPGVLLLWWQLLWVIPCLHGMIVIFYCSMEIWEICHTKYCSYHCITEFFIMMSHSTPVFRWST